MNHNTNESHTTTHTATTAHPIRRTLPIALVLVAATVLAVLAWQAQANSSSSPATTQAAHAPIEKDAVLAAQQAWGEALLSIASTYREHGAERARALAADIIDAAYAYAQGPVLFKPTLTWGDQTFRTTREGALAYFVGGDPNFPNDNGFALKPWTDFSFNNAAVWIHNDTAITMGHVHLTDKQGNTTTVDKTWAFTRDDAGDLRIVLHHSSLPFTP